MRILTWETCFCASLLSPTFSSLSVVCSVPPCLGPGCSRKPQGPLAALQKEESGAGGGRADLSVLVSTTGTVLGLKTHTCKARHIRPATSQHGPAPFLGKTKRGGAEFREVCVDLRTCSRSEAADHTACEGEDE